MSVPKIIANRFLIENEIGHGGMGTVYRATHTGLRRRVAVKVLNAEFAERPEFVERFVREAHIAARLRHPRAAMIFDVGALDDGRPFIVMEYVEGSTLAETLRREGRFTPERAARIACEILDVLAEAHRRGVVHRDLKPSNIMLGSEGVSVLDFGIAKVLIDDMEATRTCATTDSGILIGTPRYMSPEQCTGAEVGTASDLYSVGVMLYEMLAGRPPFVDALASAVLVKQATAAPPPLSMLRADAPRLLVLATHALLAKNPLHRPSNAVAARLLLERSRAVNAKDRKDAPMPFAMTIAAVSVSRRARVLGRVASLAVVSGMLSTLMFAWTRGGSSSSRAALEPVPIPNATAERASKPLRRPKQTRQQKPRNRQT